MRHFLVVIFVLVAPPDELLLFFHHVPYNYRLHSGKTVIQHIYDAHYEGPAEAGDLVRQWSSLIDSSTRRRITGLALRPGDEIRIEGIPDGAERAPLDYIEIHTR